MFAVIFAASALAIAQPEAPEQKVRMKDLPPVVQTAVQQQTAGARIKGLAKEEVEEQILLSEAPAPVQTALAGRGKLLILEKVTKGDRIAYEAHVDNKGKKSEIVLDAAGKPTKL